MRRSIAILALAACAGRPPVDPTREPALLLAGMGDHREDLKHHPRNGWALHGLAESQERQGKAGEAAVARTGFEEAWADATVTIRASCFCRGNRR